MPDDEPHTDRATFILYFQDKNGEPREALQFETLQIALDQANAICGYPQDGWTTCDIPSIQPVTITAWDSWRKAVTRSLVREGSRSTENAAGDLTGRTRVSSGGSSDLHQPA